MSCCNGFVFALVDIQNVIKFSIISIVVLLLILLLFSSIKEKARETILRGN